MIYSSEWPLKPHKEAIQTQVKSSNQMGKKAMTCKWAELVETVIEVGLDCSEMTHKMKKGLKFDFK